MYRKLTRNPASQSKGITLIEILLGLGLVIILLSFAMPSVSSALGKAEMKSTLENVRYSLDSARRTARTTETVVSLDISTSGQETIQTISYSSPDNDASANKLQSQEFSLPPEILLISDHDSFLFDARGKVQNPGRILLVSKLDESVTSTLNVK